MNTTNSLASTNSVRPELVEGVAVDIKARYLKLHDEFHEFMQTENLFNKNNNFHIYVVTLGAHFVDVLEGFHIIISHKARMTQAPVLLLRGLYETMVTLLYLADANNKSEECLISRFNSILYTDICKREELDSKIKSVFPNLIEGEAQKVAVIAKNNLKSINGVKFVNVFDMIESINKDQAQSFHLTYKKLSETAHPNIEGMRSILDLKNRKITLFDRSDSHTLMWLECAANFIDGALQASKQLLNPVRTEPVEVNENPSTSSGRTDVV